jgi:hypothetical protein
VRGHPQGAPRAPDARRLGREPLHQSHGVSRAWRRRDSLPRHGESSATRHMVARASQFNDRRRRRASAGCREARRDPADPVPGG